MKEMSNWNNETLINQRDKAPEEIFRAYCNELGEYYKNRNFKYFKSRPRIERQTNDIIESINFWSSRGNETNKYVHLEILPYIKSKSLKKWIRVNRIGRNEVLFSLKIGYPRNLGIFGHGLEDFKKLTEDIDSQVVSKLEEVRRAILDLRMILTTDKYDEGLIKDNFLAYLCMKNSDFIDDALNKYGNKLSEETKVKIEKKRKSS